MNTTSVIGRFANPGRFLALADKIVPCAGALAAVLFAAGMYYAFWGSPPDYQQGETVRIMYVHVPAAWMGLFVYCTMAGAALAGLVWKHMLADLYVKAVAPLGAGFTFICLATGSLWGRPMWGAWWAWDARLTSMLILLFLYAGYIALSGAFDDEQKGLNAGNGLVLLGAINIPVIKFSVDWFNTLHQPSSVLRLDGPAIDQSMLIPLLLMALGFKAFFVALACLRLKAEVFERKSRRGA